MTTSVGLLCSSECETRLAKPAPLRVVSRGVPGRAAGLGTPPCWKEGPALPGFREEGRLEDGRRGIKGRPTRCASRLALQGSPFASKLFASRAFARWCIAGSGPEPAVAGPVLTMLRLLPRESWLSLLIHSQPATNPCDQAAHEAKSTPFRPRGNRRPGVLVWAHWAWPGPVALQRRGVQFAPAPRPRSGGWRAGFISPPA
jgi:hypothetical protein